MDIVTVTALLLFGCADLINAQTINPSTDIRVPEGSSVMFSCSFPNANDLLRLRIGGLMPSGYDFKSIESANINKSQTLNALSAQYTIEILTATLVKIRVMFNATRGFNGYTLQCDSVERIHSTVVGSSQAVNLSVEYPPLQPAMNSVAHYVIRSFPFAFNLSCTDLLAANPLPTVTWTHDEKFPFVMSPTGQQNSVLPFRIDSSGVVVPSLFSQMFVAVCNASNKLGSATRNLSYSLSATPLPPRQAQCTWVENCSIHCTWNESVFSGSSNITHYQLVISRNGQGMTYNKTFEPGPAELYISTATSKVFYTENVEFESSLKAVNELGSSLPSLSFFTSPKSCMKIQITTIADDRINQTSVTVNWKVLDCNVLVIKTFRVTVDYKNGTHVFDRELSNRMTSVLIKSLLPDIEYTATVVGVDCYGVSVEDSQTINGDVTGTASSGSPHPTAGTTSQTQTSEKSSTDDGISIGPIIGGVVGGLAVILLVVLIVVLYCKQRQTKSEKTGAMSSSRNDTDTHMSQKKSAGGKQSKAQTTPVTEYALIEAATDVTKAGTDGLQYAELDHISSVKKGSSEVPRKEEQTAYADIRHT